MVETPKLGIGILLSSPYYRCRPVIVNRKPVDHFPLPLRGRGYR
jgi:hypothetical protein